MEGREGRERGERGRKRRGGGGKGGRKGREREGDLAGPIKIRLLRPWTNDCSDVFKVQRTENNKYLASLTLYGHIKPQSSGPIYRNTVIGTLALMGGLLHSVQRGGA